MKGDLLSVDYESSEEEEMEEGEEEVVVSKTRLYIFLYFLYLTM